MQHLHNPERQYVCTHAYVLPHHLYFIRECVSGVLITSLWCITVIYKQKINDFKMYSEGNNKSPFGCLVAWLADLQAGWENYADLGASKLDIGTVACITQWECCSGSVTLLL